MASLTWLNVGRFRYVERQQQCVTEQHRRRTIHADNQPLQRAPATQLPAD